MTDSAHPDLLGLTAVIVATHVANNQVLPTDLPTMISTVHTALAGLGVPPPPADIEQVPAVSIRASVKPEHIVCLEDGRKMKMLKRHLTTDHGMTPDQYRAKWKLPPDYPLVAPNYAEARRALAVKIGLGRKKAEAPAAPVKAVRKPRTLKLKTPAAE